MSSQAERGKQLVRRLVDEAINAGDLAVLDDICTQRFATELRAWFAPFRVGFPDWRQEIVELVAERHKIVARCVCRGTNLGTWLGVPPTGKTMRVDEVWFFTVTDERLDALWSLERRIYRRAALPEELSREVTAPVIRWQWLASLCRAAGPGSMCPPGDRPWRGIPLGRTAVQARTAQAVTATATRPTRARRPR